MNERDWAVIVGVWNYIGQLQPLKGPEHDTKAFYDWVTSETGGAVPKKNVFTLLSSEERFKGPFPDVGDALPSPENVERQFDKLDDVAKENDSKGEGRTVGRRLYLYFAGHGIAPAVDINRRSESALLLVNAGDGRFGRHIAGRTWVDWFYDAAYFEEILLFMDCCRDVASRSFPQNPHFDRLINTDAAIKTKRLLGFGTKWSLRTRERPLKEFGNKDRGIFTVALIEALNGAGAHPDGRITALTLKNYVRDRMSELLTEEDKENPDLEQKPDIEILADDEDFLLCLVAKENVPKIPVVAKIPASLTGKVFEVVGFGFNPVATAVAANGEVRFDLPTGFYEIRQTDGAARNTVDVKGTEEIHVTIQ